jgi:hypothetical protein
MLFTITVFGEDLKEVDVLLNADIKIKNDNILFTATDVNSNIVLPISYNGTTYLPIRAISELFNKEVNWNNDTQTITITDNNYVIEKEVKENNNLINSYVKAFINNGIKIIINNELIIMKDANGNIVLPISYNGSTYVPVRAISELYTKEVNWDGNNNTVYLGIKPDIYEGNEISFIDAYINEGLSFNEYTIDNNKQNEFGTLYIKQGIGYINSLEYVTGGIEYYPQYIAINNEDLNGNTIKLGLNGKFSSMSFYFNCSANDMIDISMDVYYDGEFKQTILGKRYYYIEGGYQKNNYAFQLNTLDISGVNEIEFKPNWSGNNGGNNYADYTLNNIKFK